VTAQGHRAPWEATGDRGGAGMPDRGCRYPQGGYGWPQGLQGATGNLILTMSVAVIGFFTIFGV
jgi:hypothetical protein